MTFRTKPSRKVVQFMVKNGRLQGISDNTLKRGYLGGSDIFHASMTSVMHHDSILDKRDSK